MYAALFWIILGLDIAILLTIFLGYQRIPTGRLRIIFLIFFISVLLWTNLLFMIQIVPARQCLTVSNATFCSGNVAILTGGLFLLQFADRLKIEIKLPRFWIFAGIFAINFVLLPWLNVAVGTNSIGIRYLVRGPLFSYYMITWLLWLLYTGYILRRAYKSEKSNMVRYQYQYTLFISMASGVPMILAVVFSEIFHTVVPAEYYSAIAILFFVLGLLRLLANQQYLYLKRTLKMILHADRVVETNKLSSTAVMQSILEGDNQAGILIFHYEHLLNQVEKMSDPLTSQFIQQNRPGSSQTTVDKDRK